MTTDSSKTSGSSVILIDSRVTGYQTLIDHLATRGEIFIIDAESDGVAQIAARLQGRSDIDDLHIISHGSQGALFLGATVLESGNLASYAAQLASIGSALTQSGDVLLYGCNVAQGEVGWQFIQSLAMATGADVAASSNVTGAILLGGDALLEQVTGNVAATSFALEGLNGLLAPSTTRDQGRVTTSFGSYSISYARSMALQADGKILLAGDSRISDGKADFALARYNSNGSLDSSFSGDGMLTTDFGRNDDEAYSVTLQADGKILLAGFSLNSSSEYRFALARYNSNGSLDSSFSGDGMLTTSIGARINLATSVVPQADGKILAAGYIYDSSNYYDFALVRYNSDGSLDSSFSGDGMLTTDIGGYEDQAQSVVLQVDGKILLAGYTTNSSSGNYSGNNYFALVRYNSDGSLDNSFSGDGMLTTAILAVMGYVNNVTLQADGKILLAGYTDKSGYALVRYNSDGSLDSSFSHDGMLTTNFRPTSLNLQADGKILLAGNTTNIDGNNDFALVRYNSDGSLDSSFDANNTPTGSVTISGAFTQGQTLTASNSLADVDGIPTAGDGAIKYQWKAGGTVINGASTSTYILTQAEVGKAITVTATYTDQQGTSESVTSSATAAVANINDTPTGGVTIAGTATQGQTLTASNTLVDLDGIPASGVSAIVYQWLADGANIIGGTGSTLVLTQAQVSKAISVKASYTDSLGAAESVTSAATAAIANINDAPTGTITISGIATQGQVLTASNTLADLDGIPSSGSGAVSYQWLADGVNISNATGTSFALTQAEVGKVISVKASYTDQQGTAESVTSSVTAAIANINDVPTGGVTITGTGSQGQVLTAANTLIDIDGIPSSGAGALAYQWLADGVNISGATGASFTLTQAQVGKSISVKASYTDQQGTPESVTSSATAAVANLNDAPSGSVTITGSPTQGQTLSASNTLADVDGIPTSGSGTITYQWKADGVNIAGAIGATLPLAQVHVGRAITVTASYVDLFGQAESVSSAVTSSVVAPAKYWKDAGKTPSETNKAGAVNLTDAISILKMIVGLSVNSNNAPLSPYQAVAADFDQNGSVDLGDAIGVLKMVVGLNAPAPTWKYFDDAKLAGSYNAAQPLNHKAWSAAAVMDASSTADQSVKLVGVLTGDVDGSWAG